MTQELFKTIARVRRAMPRNHDVMEICDYAERKLLEPPLIISSDGNGSVTIEQDFEAVKRNADKFDKTAYMRRYMRKRRAAAKEP